MSETVIGRRFGHSSFFMDFIKKNFVMVIALVLAVVTSVIIPPDSSYFGYFDFKTLTCLFCVLAVVSALKDINFFYLIARKITHVFGTTRLAVLAIVYITFIGSMLIANDMALLTFLPLGTLVLMTTKKEKYLPFCFIMQNIAANLGGMLTPFGNPQNLFLYSKFNIPNGEFLSIMAPPFLFSITLITLLCIVFVKSEKIEIDDDPIVLDRKKTAILLLLFAFSIIIVFRVVPYYLGLIVVPLVLLFVDRKALLKVDYPLLLTFVFFFIFAGNMGRMEGVRRFFSSFLERDTLVFSTLSCQVISNVPSAILLSQFTSDYRRLLLGVNIGGVGTLIASLASLITFREYSHLYPQRRGKYIVEFSLFNFSFLVLLILFEKLIGC